MDTFDDDTSPTAKRGACYVDAMMDESPMVSGGFRYYRCLLRRYEPIV